MFALQIAPYDSSEAPYLVLKSDSPRLLLAEIDAWRGSHYGTARIVRISNPFESVKVS